jgi:tRNA threonylcarbamoyladenosine biosynthesis protein TsaB
MGEPALLVIDSATETLSLAACARGQSAAWSAAGGAQASAVLIGRAFEMLQSLGIEPRQLDAVGFGRGPGAFTGLRTACAVAQGLGFGLGCPLVPVDSLMIVAEAARPLEPAACAAGVAVAVDARMEQVYAARYAWQGQGWQVVEPPGLWSPRDLAEAWDGPGAPAAWTGSGVGLLPRRDGRRVLPARDEQRAAAALRLALQGWACGDAVPPAEALPLYVRDKVAQTTAERAASLPRVS